MRFETYIMVIMVLRQIDCFIINMKFLKYLAVWPGEDSTPRYKYYSAAFITIYIFVYMTLFTINFPFLPKQLDVFIEDMLFYFTDCAVVSKTLTIVFMREKIYDLFDMLESDIFQPDDAEGLAIIENAKKFNKLYWNIFTSVSFISSAAHLSPIIVYFIKGTELELPVCSYRFLSENFRQMFVIPLYLYQGSGAMFHMMYNVSIDTFFAGLMVLTIAQLDILDKKLRRVTDKDEHKDANGETSGQNQDKHREAVRKINQCIIHYEEINKFRSLVQDVFSISLFVQFGMGSCIICICLMRFTMPAPLSYFLFLATYMFVMVIQIMVPCWFGQRIIDKSNLLAFSAYNCEWTSETRQFKSNMRFFVARANKPLSITGGKMFSLSLVTFTSIMNSAYSFFTLLQNVKSRK
nr:odorant receptor 2a-like [Helicoverpa armigera]